MSLHRDTRFWLSPSRDRITYREPQESGHAAYDLTAPPHDWRSLAVIDPEDHERFADILVRRVSDRLSLDEEDIGYIRDAISGAFVEFVSPKPEEPTGLGAVVEDATGCLWLLVMSNSGPFRWARKGEVLGDWLSWPQIDAIRVLSDGIPA